MNDTYRSATEADADRDEQRRLLAALGGWDRALRRDACGAWCISGSRGSIDTWGDGQTWVIYVACRSALHWTHTKMRLAGCCIATQDGDDEGCLRLLRLPTDAEATAIRQVLGIRKRTVFAPAELERRRTLMKSGALAPGRANHGRQVSGIG